MSTRHCNPAENDDKYRPAYNGAKFDRAGYCLKHPMIRLCKINEKEASTQSTLWAAVPSENLPMGSNNSTNEPGNNEVKYIIVRKTCPMCGEHALRNERKLNQKSRPHGYSPSEIVERKSCKGIVGGEVKLSRGNCERSDAAQNLNHVKYGRRASSSYVVTECDYSSQDLPESNHRESSMRSSSRSKADNSQRSSRKAMETHEDKKDLVQSSNLSRSVSRGKEAHLSAQGNRFSQPQISSARFHRTVSASGYPSEERKISTKQDSGVSSRDRITVNVLNRDVEFKQPSLESSFSSCQRVTEFPRLLSKESGGGNSKTMEKPHQRMNPRLNCRRFSDQGPRNVIATDGSCDALGRRNRRHSCDAGEEKFLDHKHRNGASETTVIAMQQRVSSRQNETFISSRRRSSETDEDRRSSLDSSHHSNTSETTDRETRQRYSRHLNETYNSSHRRSSDTGDDKRSSLDSRNHSGAPESTRRTIPKLSSNRLNDTNFYPSMKGIGCLDQVPSASFYSRGRRHLAASTSGYIDSCKKSLRGRSASISSFNRRSRSKSNSGNYTSSSQRDFSVSDTNALTAKSSVTRCRSLSRDAKRVLTTANTMDGFLTSKASTLRF